MSQRFYPRNDLSRRDAVANGRLRVRNDLSRLDGLFTKGKQFDSVGCLRVQSYDTVYEGTIASSGWTVGVQITNKNEKWNATASRVKSEAAVGASSFGLAADVASIARTGDQFVTFGIGPDATYVASAPADYTLTVVRSGFQYRTLPSNTVKLLTVEPFSLSYSGPSSLGTDLMTGTTGIVAALTFTINNSAETFAGLAAATIASLFVGIPIKQNSVWYDAANKVLTVTAVGSSTVSGDKFKPNFPANTTFTLRKAAFDTGTLCVIA